METAIQVPRGQRVPGLNRIVCPHILVTVPSSSSYSVANSSSFVNQSHAMRDPTTAERRDRAAKSKRSISRSRRAPTTTRMSLSIWGNDVDAEYEVDSEYIAAVPAAAADSLSVYKIIPNEDGGTVIPHSPHSPRRQAGAMQLPSPQSRKVSLVLVH